MKVLLTGYSGFVGRYLARAFKKHGYSVRVLLHRRTVPKREFLLEAHEVVWGGIHDVETIRQATAGIRIVVHSAWAPSRSSAKSPSLNERGAQLLLEESVRNEVERFVFLSSVAVYGMKRQTDSVISESAQLVHTDELDFAYPSEKRAVENRLLTLEKKHTKLAIFRPGPIFDANRGPAKKRVRVFGATYAVGLGHGRNQMPYIHVQDVCQAILKWVQNGQNDVIFNVTPSNSLSALDWLVRWGDVTGQSQKPVFVRPLFIRFFGFAVNVLKRVLRKQGKADFKYALSSATRNLIYSNLAIKNALGWTDSATAQFTSSDPEK
ncbi:MAG: NAD-dependent epimerase/dehydratase family protein [bacterium]